jgi:simple sugar transport system ATP-binding protein
MNNLVLAYGDTPVVHDFSLTVSRGELHALVGENGAGKTTIIKAIGSLLPISNGNLTITSRSEALDPRIGIVLQHDVLPDNLTVDACITCAAIAANQNTSNASVLKQIERVDLSVSPRSKVGTLTLNERQLLQLACALAAEPEILLLDEPTAVMSQVDAERFWKLIKSEVQQGRTVMIATHKLEDVIAYCSHVSVLRLGKQVFTRRVDMVTIEDIILGMSPESPLHTDRTPKYPYDRPTAALVQITTADSKLELYKRKVHGIAGLDSSGYNAWLSSLAVARQNGFTVEVNQQKIDDFSIAQRRKLGIGFVPADRHADAVVGNETIKVNMSFGRIPDTAWGLWRPIRHAVATASARTITAKYDVRPQDVERDIDTLSGGNQQKFVVGRELERDSIVVVMNQPTRGMDRAATIAVSNHIRNAAADSDKSFLIYSDDLNFLLSTCDDISTVSNGLLTHSKPANEWTEAALIEAIV